MPSLAEISSLPAVEAIPLLDEYINNHTYDDEAYTIRGLKHWSVNQRKEAINDYLTALRINPDSRAKTALDFANSVLDFYNKDLLNP